MDKQRGGKRRSNFRLPMRWALEKLRAGCYSGPPSLVMCSAAMVLPVVYRTRLLPWVFARTLKAPEPPLRVLLLQGSPTARAGVALLGRVGVRRAYVGPVPRR